jgi:hypothetical protein
MDSSLYSADAAAESDSARSEEAAKLEADLLSKREQVIRPRATYPEREETLLGSALFDIQFALKNDYMTAEIRRLLANFVASVRASKNRSLARRILDLPPARGAPGKHVLWYEAECNYEHWIENGHSDEEALRVCWETVYPDKDYETELRRHQGESNAYAEQIKKIKVKLNRRGARSPAPRGRKRREKAT